MRAQLHQEGKTQPVRHLKHNFLTDGIISLVFITLHTTRHVMWLNW